MKTLIVLRHAKSSWDHAELADHDRPLNARGKRDAPRMGRLLAAESLLPELILTSSAKRALKTAQRVRKAAGCHCPIEVSEQLFHAAPPEILQVLHAHGDQHQRVMVIGHNPGLEQFVRSICGSDVILPTAAVAAIDLHANNWSDVTLDGAGTLMRTWRPRDLDEQ